MASTSNVTLKFIADLSDFDKKLSAFQARAKAAASTFKGSISAQEPLTRPKARAVAAARGKEQASARLLYETGSFGAPGSKEAKAQLNKAYATIRREFAEIEKLIPAGDREHYQKQVKIVQQEQLALMHEQKATLLGETVTEKQASVNAKKAKQQKAAAEKARAAAAEQARIEAAKEANFERESSAQYIELNKAYNRSQRKVLAAQKRVEKEALKRAALDEEGSKATPADKGRQTRRVKAAEAKLAAAKEAEAAAAQAAALKAFDEAKLDEIVGRRDPNIKPLVVDEAPIKKQREKAAKAAAESTTAAEQLTKAEQELAAIEAEGVPKTKKQKQRLAAAQKAVADATEAAAVSITKEKTESVKLDGTVKEQKRRAAAAEARSAKAAEQAAVAATSGKKPARKAEDPNEIARRKEAELVARIRANEQLLGAATPADLSQNTYQDNLALYAQQKEALRLFVAEQKEQWRAQARQAQLQKKFGNDLTTAELEAASAAEGRADEIIAGANQEKAFYKQLQGRRRIELSEETQLLKLIGEQRAIREARVQLERAAEADAIQRLGLRDEIVGGKVASRKEEALQQAAITKRLAADQDYINATVQEAAIRKSQAAQEAVQIEQQLQADAAYVAATRQAAALKQQATLAELQYKSANVAYLQNEAQIQAETAAIKQLQKNLELEILIADKAALKEKAKGVVLEEQYNRALRAEVQAQAAEAGLTRGGAFSRFFSGHGGFGGGGGRYGIGNQGGAGAFFGGGLATTLKYAVPSALLFGAVGGITSSIKSAQELEKIMNQIEAQFVAVDKAAEFPEFKQSILDIARDSGLAAEAVAEIGFQLQGAFGQNVSIAGTSGQGLVEDQLEASAEISRVTQLSQKEIVDSLTAASFAFNASFREIGNVTLQLQDRFGVLAKEIIPFLGDIAPVAQAAGFSLEEFATIAAVTQQKSGRSGTALAEAYGRVLPAIQENKQALIELAAINPSLNTPEFLTAVNQGDAGPIFLALADAFDSMNKSSQDMVISLLGGRREASAIISAFEDGDTLLEEINKTNKDNNVLAERYAKLQETLNQQVARLAESFRQFGVELYEAGLGDALKVLVQSIQTLLSAFSDILELFGAFNKLLGGIPAKLLAILAVIKLIQVAMGTNFGSRIGAIPGSIATSFRNAPSLAVGAYNAAGFVDTARQQGLRGPNRALGPNGVIGGSSVAQIGAVALAAFTVAKLGETRDDVSSQLDEAGQVVTDRLARASQEELTAFNEQRNSFLDKVRSDGVVATVTPWLTGTGDLGTRGIDAQQQRDAPRILAALRAFQNLETPGFQKDEELLNEVIANFSEDPTNDQFYKDAADYLNLAADVSTAAKEAINNQLGVSQDIIDRQLEATDAAAAAIAGMEATTQTLDQAKSGFELGVNSLTDVTAAYDTLVNSLETALAGPGQPDPALVQQLMQVRAEYQQFLASQLTSANELRTTLDSATGGGSTEQQIGNLQALLDDPRFTDPAARQQAALDIVALSQELLQKRAEAADSAGEALRILQRGIPLGDDARAALIVSQLRGSFPVQEFIAGFSGVAQKFMGDIEQQIAEIMIETGQAANEATLVVVNNAIRRLVATLGYASLTPRARARILRGLSSLYRQRDALQDAGDFDINPVDSVKGSADDIASATADSWQAAADYARDQQQKLDEWRQAARDIEDARADLFRATIDNDPVAVARFEQSEADRAFRNAETAADRIRAQADRIRADRALQDAIHDVFESQFDLVQAMFEYGDHTIQAAQLGLKRANDQLSYLQATGAGDAAINRAKADVITAQGALRDARLDRKLSDYQFLYDMDRINKQQYIQYLLQLKQIPDLTKKQLQDLDRQIKQLRDELGSDFQFNLPTNIALPTLYEVRRANQTPGGAGAYQDNRNYNIVLYVNNGMDEAAAQQFLSDTLGTNRLSTGIRRY